MAEAIIKVGSKVEDAEGVTYTVINITNKTVQLVAVGSSEMLEMSHKEVESWLFGK
tara:strand:- start:3250 stop:3417 length:168 start_codon:yes stop_codon:yes gene_type:complete